MRRFKTHNSQFSADCRAGLWLAVRLGSPRGGGCSGSGICKVFFEDEWAGAAAVDPLSLAGAWFRLDRPTGRLLLHFDRASMNGATRRRYFADGFRMDDDYRLPERLTRLLWLPPGVYSIAAGHYPALQDDTFITLSLRLTECEAHRLRLAA